MQGMKEKQNNGNRQNRLPQKEDLDMSGTKEGATSAMSHTHMDQPTEPLNDQLGGLTPFSQPGPRTTRLMPSASQTISRPSETRKEEVPLRVGPEVAMVATDTSPKLHD